MILKALTLENFKGIHEPVRIELSPITLLFGPNNAGKSTVLHALIYARELFERGNADPRYTEMGGETIDLGGFDSLVFGNDRSRRIKMRFEFEVAATELVSDSRPPAPAGFYRRKGVQPDVPGVPERAPDWLGAGPLWQYSRLGLVVGKIQGVTEMVGMHPTRWLEVEIGWGKKQQRALVMSCSTGIADDDQASIDFTLNEESETIELSRLDFGSVRLGKIENEELKKLRIKLNEELNAQPFIVFASDTYSEEELKIISEIDSLKQVYNDAVEALDDLSIPTSDLLRGLIHPEYLNEAGWLKPLPVAPGQSALPDRNLWFSLTPQSHKKDPETEKCPPLCDWIDPEVFIGERLDPLINAQMTAFVNACRSYFTDSLYLSAIRVNPPRDFSPVLPVDLKRWPNGLAAWDLLFAKEDGLLDDVNAWLSGNPDRFASGFEVEVQHAKQVDVQISPMVEFLAGSDGVTLDQLREHLLQLPERRLMRIRNLTTGALGHPRDIGYGLSQLLPVIVATLDTKAGIVSVEEPESNIHPAFQVVLADLFISQAKANPGALFLIETHSEHLMLRCLRRIRQTSEGELGVSDPSLQPDDISVNFVEPSEGSPRFHRIRIDADGEFLDPWPRGFFSERMKEVYGDDL